MAEAGIGRDQAFVTNAVKHFKFLPHGKRRLHQRPTAEELTLCRWWLEQETKLVAPVLIVALGTSAARSVFGRTVTVGKVRGTITQTATAKAMATIHPSFLLRMPDPETRRREYAAFVNDLVAARQFLAAHWPA